MLTEHTAKTDQTGLIGVFALNTSFVGFVMSLLICWLSGLKVIKLFHAQLN